MTVSNEVIDNEPQAPGRIDRLFAVVDRILGRMRANHQSSLHLCTDLV
ncbi:MAG: hypothetical protein ACLQJ0_06925 [Steroidobacteraceae bacterium]